MSSISRKKNQWDKMNYFLLIDFAALWSCSYSLSYFLHFWGSSQGVLSTPGTRAAPWRRFQLVPRGEECAASGCLHFEAKEAFPVELLCVSCPRHWVVLGHYRSLLPSSTGSSRVTKQSFPLLCAYSLVRSSQCLF